MTDPTDKKTKSAAGVANDPILNDEKATAKSKGARRETESTGTPLGDALALGGGQQSTPYQLATQADAIAKQTKRSKT